MHKHPYFQLYLHSNAELESLLHDKIVERSSLHEWPLSSVELLKTAPGQRWVYKSQTRPSVEAKFYENASSPILLSCTRIESPLPGHSHLLLPYFSAPQLEAKQLTVQEVLSLGQELHSEISAIQGDLPVYLDIGTAERWHEQLATLLKELEYLRSREIFQFLSLEDIRKLDKLGQSQEILSTFDSPAYLHGDLSGKNVFVSGENFKVIDWQRPLRGPIDLDRAILLTSLGFNPANLLNPGIIKLMLFLHIRWLSECALRWFPEGSKHYDQQIKELCQKLK